MAGVLLYFMLISFLNYSFVITYAYLLPTNEVWGKVIFCTCLSFCSQGGVLGQVPHPRQVHPLAGTPPGRYTPWQVPPQAGTPPVGRYTPQAGTPLGRFLWAGTPPRTRYPPGPGTPPREQCMLGDTGNKRTVRILLECVLVCFIFSFVFHKPVKESDIFILFTRICITDFTKEAN